jgi:acetoin utilization deacetylase AcuC-like enzyme
MMPLALFTSDRFSDHVTPPGHPERVERAEVMEVVAARWTQSGGAVVAPREATDEELARVHDSGYIASLRASRGRPRMLDPDTFTSPASDEVARLAAGAVIGGIDYVLGAARGRRAFAMVRPPGHHAERDRAMGFCLYNSIAVGAAHARSRGLARVAVVDFDVHHGNGTQWMFYDDPSILVVSSHQFPFYPGTGDVDETGRVAGTGYTLNLPMEAGATDADFDLVYRTAVVPVLQEFRPDLLLVSAGFDAHERDPLAGMRMTSDGFGALVTHLVRAADQLCGGRVVLVTEGGYDTSALAECCQRVIDITSATDPPPAQIAAGDTRRGAATLTAVRRAHAAHWACLR